MIDEHDAAPSEDDTPTEIFRPIRVRERRKARWTGALAVLVVVILGVSCYEVIAGVGNHPAAKAAGAAGHLSPPPVSLSSAAVATPSTSAPPSPSAAVSSAPAPSLLRVVTAAAFGPSGLSSGDNPQLAARVLGGQGGWQSDWYVTPQFGGLKHGTGLLLDMGTTVTITQVEVELGKPAGGTLELRAGDSAALGALALVAAPGGAGGGMVTITLSRPVQARYLLLWFTRLAPDDAGHYQAVVDGIKVLGTA